MKKDRQEQLNYSKSILLYGDKPKYGLILKLILLIPVALLVGGLYLWLTGENYASLALSLEGILIGLIYWLVFPREYQVYDDQIRIVLGGPFSVKVKYQNIKTVRITSRASFTVNFVTRVTRSYVEIAKKRGWSIAITPTDSESFVENANRALGQWLKNKT
jgi:hypothetical protein